MALNRAEAEALFQQWLPLVPWALQRFYGITSSHQDYEEIAQEAYKLMWMSVLRYDPERGVQFNTFATNALRRFLPRLMLPLRNHGFTGRSNYYEGVAKPKNVEPGIFAGLAAHEDQDANNDAEYINELVSRLPEREAFVIRQIFFEGKTNVQTGELLGVSHGRIDQLKQRALAKLKEMAA